MDTSFPVGGIPLDVASIRVNGLTGFSASAATTPSGQADAMVFVGPGSGGGRPGGAGGTFYVHADVVVIIAEGANATLAPLRLCLPSLAPL